MIKINKLRLRNLDSQLYDNQHLKTIIDYMVSNNLYSYMVLYLGSNISSTKRNVNNTFIDRAWIATDGFITVWKCDFTDKIKQEFFQAVFMTVLLYGHTTWTLREWLEKNPMRTMQGCCI